MALSSPEDHSRPSRLVGEQPALGIETPAVPYQRAILAHDPMAGDEDREVVGCGEPADLTRVEPGGAGDLFVRAGLSEPDLPQRPVDCQLSGREIEPVAKVAGKRKSLRLACKICIEPSGGDGAGPLRDVEFRQRCTKAHRPTDPSGAVRELHGERPRIAFDNHERADRRHIRGPLHPHGRSPGGTPKRILRVAPRRA